MSGPVSLPDGFADSLAEILPAGERAELLCALDTPPPAAVRFNPYKLASPPEGEQVPWCRYGFYVDGGRPSFTLDPLHHGGVYYVQEPSSMFIEHIVRQVFPDTQGLRMLDVCAAPGGKTTLLSTLAGLEGLVVANEPVWSRVNILAENIRRWGLGNVAVTANAPSHYAAIKDYFDLVLVDAPCSGEGMFRKNPQARTQWSSRNVAACTVRQKDIIENIWGCLKPGGILIYSTCTFNSHENEHVASWTAENFDCENIGIDYPGHWNIAKGIGPAGGYTLRFYPHKLKGDGFSVSVFRKEGSKVRTKIKPVRKTLLRDLVGREAKEAGRWVEQPQFMRFAAIGDQAYGFYSAVHGDIIRLSEAVNIIYSGIDMGRIIKGDLKPSHALALFHDVNTGEIPGSEVPLETALDYLRKSDIPAEGFREGYNLVTFSGYPLGWVKRIGGRINNLYPKELRIANL
ncbi:MAG: rRNA cytosine-C5-methylase [Rikenellaceae bacterium]|nr:rRNA cytosine-C5-methylase [Rikenellaceae bacterium]